ncbi:MAG: sigma-70 family RNA polymerase sigma factor [Chitinophagales bacterium]|nr:sigma-70 family RNA polymerase sigma factor [Chitinophagales bacterium]
MQDSIIIQLQQQDQRAIATLYDQYSAALFGVIMRIVQSRELSEQVLQDTFTKAWRNGASYNPEKGRLFTWLLNIARNSAIDATRSAQFNHSKKSDSLDSLVHTPGSEQINPEHVGLRELVGKLDEKYARLIEMVYFQGYTQEEVAEATGIPLGTVKTRLRFAINELRLIFSDNPAAMLLIGMMAERI